MPNVMFKRGLHSALPDGSANKPIQDGVFYLTTDTNRLYIGQTNGTTVDLVELNKSITTVNTIADLPKRGVEVGQFYYVKGPDTNVGNIQNGNILAVVVSGGQNTDAQWVQVNPDTDTGFNYNDTASFSSGTTSGSTVTYTLTLNAKHRTGAGANIEDVSTGYPGMSTTATLTISASELNGILTASSVGLSTTLSNDNKTFTVSTTGSGADSSKVFALKAGTNVAFAGTTNGSNKDITISATDTTYALDFTGTANSGNTDGTASLSFKENGTQASSINFTAGNKLNVSGGTANTVTYSHETITQATATSDGAATVTGYSEGATDETFTVVDSIQTDGYGHTTGYKTKTVTISDHQYKAGTISAKANGGLQFTITDPSGSESTTSTGGNNILYHTITVYDEPNPSTTPTAQTKYNQSDLGTFYSKTAIDNIMRDLNAMTYKGTIGTGASDTVSALPTSNVHAGDTYFVNQDTLTISTSPSVTAQKGDLLIASGTEVNGVIPSANLKWTVVESGKDADTTYTFSVDNNAIKVTSHVGSTDATSTIATIAGGTALTASTSGTTITLNHDNSGVTIPSGSTTVTKGDNGSSTAALGYSGTFKVPKITVNAQGHITAIDEKTITLPASDDTTYELSTAAGASSNKAKVVLTASSSGTSNALFESDGVVTLTGSSSNISIGHADVLGSAATNIGNATATLTAGGTFTIPRLSVTAEGHVSAIAAQTLTLPNDTTYTLSGATTATTTDATNGNGVTVTHTLTNNLDNNDTSNSNTTFRSKSLTISKPNSTTNIVQIELEWGSF